MTREQAIVEIERLQEVLREICKEADLCLKTQGSTAKGNGARYSHKCIHYIYIFLCGRPRVPVAPR